MSRKPYPVSKKGRPFGQPFLSFNLSPAGSEAFAAVHGTIFLGLKGHLSGFATLGADRVVHHARGAGSGTARFPRLTASLAAGGFVFEALLRVEFLFTGGENEFLSTIFANQRLVFVHSLGNPQKN